MENYTSRILRHYLLLALAEAGVRIDSDIRTELDGALDGLDNRITEMEDRINALEDRLIAPPMSPEMDR